MENLDKEIKTPEVVDSTESSKKNEVESKPNVETTEDTKKVETKENNKAETPKEVKASEAKKSEFSGERRAFDRPQKDGPRIKRTFATSPKPVNRDGGSRDGRFTPGDRKFGPKGSSFKGGNSKFGNKPKFIKKDGRRPFDKPEVELFSEIITVKRVTRVVKGGKRMRFAALVVVGDKKGTIGFANKKGMDFQDAVAKATKKAKENMIKIKLNDNDSLPFSTVTKFKSAKILLKPANKGTSLIAGGYVRPVLELVGIKNIYSKIQGSNNKVVGVEAVINALKNYQ
ncbi:MAG: ribosomal protein S5 [Patescibacteria group bacterium]